MAGNRVHIIIALFASTAAMAMPIQARAQNVQVYEFNLPPQALGDALRAVAAKAGWELYAPANEVNGIQAPRLQARLTARQAIEQLLAGTNLIAQFSRGAVIIRERSEPVAADDTPSADITVTGSRIRGAPATAPVTIVTANDIRRAGQADLGDRKSVV